MERILIAYTTNSGTTTEVAKTIGEELAKAPAEVEILRLEEISTLEPYTAVVIGAPMMMGWHRTAVKFVKAHQEALSHLPVAYFFTAMRLTQTPDKQVSSVPIYVDANLARAPKKAGHLSFKERYATPTNYLKTALKAAPQVKPVSAAFFGGRLDLFRLKWWQMAFVMFIVQASPGEFRNWLAIREWAASLPKILFK
jgi:menaquinone-dependent protoporphyrinogen oxidase